LVNKPGGKIMTHSRPALVLFLGLVSCCFLFDPAVAQETTGGDAAAIGNLNEAYVVAFNGGDAKKLAQCFSAESEYTLLTGDTVSGRPNVARAHESFFQHNPNAKIEGQQLAYRQIRPTLVLASGKWKVTSGPSEYPSSGLWYTVVAKRGDKWRYEAMRLMIPVVAAQAE
jgi:uncharacterized protein (TIGR02246 family)